MIVVFHLGALIRRLERRATSGRRFFQELAEVGMNRHSNRHTPPKGSASCVQSFDDSQFSAIRITYRISLRSSSLWEPRHPLLKVLTLLHFHREGRESLRPESAQSYPESLTRLSNEFVNRMFGFQSHFRESGRKFSCFGLVLTNHS